MPPRAAQTLCQDALVFGRLWGNQTRAPGQILFHGVADDEPAGKPLKDCRMIEVRLTLRADEDLALRQTKGLPTWNRTLAARLSREPLEQGAVLSLEDLAEVLRLSVATIKRFKQALAQTGTPFKTRGDVADIGPALTSIATASSSSSSKGTAKPKSPNAPSTRSVAWKPTCPTSSASLC